MAAPGVEDAQAVGHAGYALWIFAVPLLIAALIEAPIAFVSDRLRRERLLRVGLVVLAAALALAALAERPWLLSMALAVAGAASGVACSSAQGALVAASNGRADRAMSRWATFAAAGDSLAPLVVGAVLWAGGSYRGALLVVAAAILAQALLGRPPAAAAPAVAADDEPREPLRAALGRPRLWALLLAGAACTLLDEIVIALAALRMTRDLGASQALTAASLTAASLGELAGAAALDAVLNRLSGRALLVWSAAASAAALGLLVAAPSPWLACGALLLLGVAAAPQYPLLKAAAYDVVPGRPGLVNAAAQLFVVLEIGLPLAIGVLAARAGLAVALAALAAQPVAVLIAAWWLMRRTPPPAPAGAPARERSS